MNSDKPLLWPAWLLKINLVLMVAIAILASLGYWIWAGQMLAITLAMTAIAMQRLDKLSTFAFTFWVLAVVAQAFVHPPLFMHWPNGPAKTYIPLLIQIVMFGMGTTLSIQDFARVLLVPKSVGIGMLLQFSVMPLTGWILARLFGFEPAVAAGVILIGSCPGGVASNVITYLAKGDVALSVTMTACSTLMAPIMTPLAMSILASSDLEVSFMKMMWSILEITILPIVAGLIVSYFFQWMRWRGPWMDRALSVLAMLAICIVIGIIVAQSRDDLMTIGPAIALAAVLHNAIGYAIGYFAARGVGLDEVTSRTISIEVGMQNGGLSTALAMDVLKSPQAALAGAIFGPWMNVSGSVLASFWRQRPIEPKSNPK